MSTIFVVYIFSQMSSVEFQESFHILITIYFIIWSNGRKTREEKDFKRLTNLRVNLRVHRLDHRDQFLKECNNATNIVNWNTKDRCRSRKNEQNQWSIFRRSNVRKSCWNWSQRFVNLFHFNTWSLNRRFDRFNHAWSSCESFKRCERCCKCENVRLMKRTNVLHCDEVNDQWLFWL